MQEALTDAQQGHLRGLAGQDGGVAVGVVDMVDGESPVMVRNKRLSKRMSVRESMRESMSEGDRQLKKLFMAIQDGDTNLVRVKLGGERDGREGRGEGGEGGERDGREEERGGKEGRGEGWEEGERGEAERRGDVEGG